MNPVQRDSILKVLQNLQAASDGLGLATESFKREEAFRLIEAAHQAVALLLLGR